MFVVHRLESRFGPSCLSFNLICTLSAAKITASYKSPSPLSPQPTMLDYQISNSSVIAFSVSGPSYLILLSLSSTMSGSGLTPLRRASPQSVRGSFQHSSSSDPVFSFPSAALAEWQGLKITLAHRDEYKDHLISPGPRQRSLPMDGRIRANDVNKWIQH